MKKLSEIRPVWHLAQGRFYCENIGNGGRRVLENNRWVVVFFQISLPFISETGFAGTGTGTPYSTFRFDLHFRSTDADPVFRSLLEPFLGPIWSSFGVTFRVEIGVQNGNFF